MASFPKLVLTNKGIALQTKAQGGSALSFTRVAMGDGSLNGLPISPLTALISQKVNLEVAEGKRLSSNTYQIGAFFSNTAINIGFWWREIGIFATDPDDGEILYAYSNAGDAGDYIPTAADQRIEKYIYCSTGIGNATNVTVNVSSGDVYVTRNLVGQPNGVASLGSNGKVPVDQLPAIDVSSKANTDFSNVLAGTILNAGKSAGLETTTGAQKKADTAERNAITAAANDATSKANAVAAMIPSSLPANGGNADYADTAGNANALGGQPPAYYFSSSNKEFVTGYYTGNGYANHVMDIGFIPVYMEIWSPTVQAGFRYFNPTNEFVYFGSFNPTRSPVVISGTQLTIQGSSASDSANMNNAWYRYIAFK